MHHRARAGGSARIVLLFPFFATLARRGSEPRRFSTDQNSPFVMEEIDVKPGLAPAAAEVAKKRNVCNRARAEGERGIGRTAGQATRGDRCHCQWSSIDNGIDYAQAAL